MAALETPEFMVSKMDEFGSPNSYNHYSVGWAWGRLSENSVVSIKNKSFSVTADVDVPTDGAEGVIIAQGGHFGGWTFYVKDGRAKFVYDVLGIQEFPIEADVPIPAGQPPGAHGGRL